MRITIATIISLLFLSEAVAQNYIKNFIVSVPCNLTADSDEVLTTWSCTSVKQKAIYRRNKQSIGNVNNKEFLQAYEENLMSAGIKDWKYTTVNGVSAIYYSVETYIPITNANVRNESAILTGEGYSYTFNITSYTTSSKQESELFKKVANSFILK